MGRDGGLSGLGFIPTRSRGYVTHPVLFAVMSPHLNCSHYEETRLSTRYLAILFAINLTRGEEMLPYIDTGGVDH